MKVCYGQKGDGETGGWKIQLMLGIAGQNVTGPCAGKRGRSLQIVGSGLK